METAKIKLKVFLITIFTIAAVEILTWRFGSRLISDSLVKTGFARIIEICFVIFVVLFFGNGMNSIGLASSTIRKGIKKGIIWSVSFGVIALMAAGILFICDINFLPMVSSRLPKKVDDFVLLILISGIIGPVFEEIFFRGICYGFFRRFGILIAMALTTLIFVLPHNYSSRIPVTQAIGGIVFVLAYELEKNLMVPIIIHISGNFAIFAVSLLAFI